MQPLDGGLGLHSVLQWPVWPHKSGLDLWICMGIVYLSRDHVIPWSFVLHDTFPQCAVIDDSNIFPSKNFHFRIFVFDLFWTMLILQ